MDSVYTWLFLIFALYAMLCATSGKKPLFFTFGVFFLFVSYVFRTIVPLEINADYYGQYYMARSDFDFTFSSIFSEPYLFFIYRFFKEMYKDSESSFNVIYILNFFTTSLFFIWLAFRKDLMFSAKLMLFAFFYFLFTYTLIRNSNAYILLGVFFYYFVRGRKFYPAYSSFLFHASSLPVVALSFLGLKKPSKKIFLYMLLGGSIILIGLNTPVFSHLFSKFSAYQELDYKINKTFHYTYFLFVLVFVYFIYKQKSRAVYNVLFLSLLLLYIILFVTNPIMSFRFSVYLMLYLLLYPLDIPWEKYHGLIYFPLIIIFFAYFSYTFFSNSFGFEKLDFYQSFIK